MRSKSLVTFVLLFAGEAAFSQEQNPLVGTWKMVSINWKTGDSTGNIDGTTLNHIKIITPTHYATLTQNMDGTFRRAEGGMVKLDGNTYSETPTHGSNTAIIGKSKIFKYEITGNKMHSVVNSSQGYFDEIWQLVQ